MQDKMTGLPCLLSRRTIDDEWRQMWHRASRKNRVAEALRFEETDSHKLQRSVVMPNVKIVGMPTEQAPKIAKGRRRCERAVAGTGRVPTAMEILAVIA